MNTHNLSSDFELTYMRKKWKLNVNCIKNFIGMKKSAFTVSKQSAHGIDDANKALTNVRRYLRSDRLFRR